MGRPGVVPVFVGNISFETTEEMVRDVFSEVGPVLAVRFATAKDTGKPKGYGFVEFGDSATADAAVRNLNGREVGGRPLRVDFAEHADGSRVVVGSRRDGIRTNPVPMFGGGWGSAAPMGLPAAQAAAQAMAAAYGAPPPAVPGGAAPGAPPDLITQRLAEVSPRAMYDIMAQVKALASANPAQARALLTANPSLTRALFQAQLVLGMVRSPAEGAPVTVTPGAPMPPPAAVPLQHLGGVVPAPMAIPPPQQQPMLGVMGMVGMAPPGLGAPMGAMPMGMQPPGPLPQQVQVPLYGGGYGGGVPVAQPPQAQAPPPWMPPGLAAGGGGYPGGGVPPPGADAYGRAVPPAAGAYSMPVGMGGPPQQPPPPHGWAPQPPPPQLPPQPPPPQQQPLPLPPAVAGMDVAQQQALLAQVMRLTEAQIGALPEAERAQVRMLQGLARSHLGGGGGAAPPPQQRF